MLRDHFYHIAPSQDKRGEIKVMVNVLLIASSPFFSLLLLFILFTFLELLSNKPTSRHLHSYLHGVDKYV